MITLPNSKRLKRFLPLTALVVIVVVALGFAGMAISKAFKKPSASDPRIVISDAKATQKINKDYSYPINDAEGVEVTRLRLHLDTIEKRDEIIVNGQRATAVKGRTFLILTVKIDNNNYNNPLQANIGDYFRLTLNGNEKELLAPEIHSDPVTIQSASTKLTRIGFPVSDSDKKMALWVGEIKGQKEKIALSL